MKKEYRNKMISEAKEETKGAEQVAALRCLRECVAPGYGFFKPGQIVKDAAAVEYLKSNPNFEPTKEVA